VGPKLRSIKRAANATPATGSAKAHELEHKTLITLALGNRHITTLNSSSSSTTCAASR